MKIIDLVKESLRSLGVNKLRSGLTILGIIIGIASIVSMISIGQGAKEQIAKNVESLGTNILNVFPGIIQPGRGLVSGGRGSAQSLTMKDVEEIRKLKGVVSVSPEISRRFQVVAPTGNNINTLILGVSLDYQNVRNVKVSDGVFISDDDVRNFTRVAVLGPTIAKDLFEDINPIGQKIRINKITFKVIGVLEPKGTSGPINPDEYVLIPLTSMQKFLTGSEYLSQIAIQVENKDLIEPLKEEITDLLIKVHRVEPNNPDFSVVANQDFLQAFTSILNTFTIFLASIAGISLIVGGIGIMNMMLTIVTERIKEIGLRKAIGAKNREILWQFLLESIFLTLIGGFLGIILGYLISISISKFANIATQVSLFSIILAFSFSATVGLIFGYWPAKRASKLNPIEALRYE